MMMRTVLNPKISFVFISILYLILFSSKTIAGCGGPVLYTSKGFLNPSYISLGDSIKIYFRMEGSTCDPATNFQWFRNDTLIHGAISDNYLATKSGVYKVIFSVYGYGPTSLSTEIKYASTSGLNEMELINSFGIFPNPANKIITIALSNTKHDIKIDLLDGLGRISISNINPLNTIDVSDLPRGLYFIRIEEETGVAYKKIVLF